MKKTSLSIIFHVFTLGLLFCLNPQRDYFEQISFIKLLGNNFVIKEIGSVSYDNITYPVSKITYNPNSTSRKRFLLLCGVHGNEPAPVLAIGSFLKVLNSKKISTTDPCIDFIYIINPWGFSFDQRTNRQNIDINRDITTQVAQETQLLRNVISISDYSHVFDFHEGNAKGYYLYYYNKKQTSNAHKIITIYKQNKVPLENEYTDVILKAENGLIFVPWYARKYMESKKNVTTTLWTYNKGIDCSFTIETSKNRNLEERIKVIINILEEIVRGSF